MDRKGLVRGSRDLVGSLGTFETILSISFLGSNLYFSKMIIKIFKKVTIFINLNILAVFLARADIIGWLEDWFLFLDLDDDRCLEDDLDFLRLRPSWSTSRWVLEFFVDLLVLAWLWFWEELVVAIIFGEIFHSWLSGAKSCSRFPEYF